MNLSEFKKRLNRLEGKREKIRDQIDGLNRELIMIEEEMGIITKLLHDMKKNEERMIKRREETQEELKKLRTKQLQTSLQLDKNGLDKQTPNPYSSVQKEVQHCALIPGNSDTII